MLFRIQLKPDFFSQADTLKAKLLLKWDLLNEPGLRITQHQLQTIYHQVLVLDLEYALDKKVEQELWTFGFKHYISALQEITRDKKVVISVNLWMKIK